MRAPEFTSAVRLLLIAIALAANGVAAQGPSRSKERCFAPPPGSDAGGLLWANNPVLRAADARTTADELARHLAGTWELLSVATEGIQSPHAEIGSLRVVATDSAARIRCPLGQCRGGYSFPAAGQLLHAGARFDSAAAAQHRMRDANDAGFSYNPTLNSLTLTFGPPVFDDGDLYEVSLLSDTTFAGRWQSGGFAYGQVSRGGVTVLEKPAGYFCARRVSP